LPDLLGAEGSSCSAASIFLLPDGFCGACSLVLLAAPGLLGADSCFVLATAATLLGARGFFALAKATGLLGAVSFCSAGGCFLLLAAAILLGTDDCCFSFFSLPGLLGADGFFVLTETNLLRADGFCGAGGCFLVIATAGVLGAERFSFLLAAAGLRGADGCFVLLAKAPDLLLANGFCGSDGVVRRATADLLGVGGCFFVLATATGLRVANGNGCKDGIFLRATAGLFGADRFVVLAAAATVLDADGVGDSAVTVAGGNIDRKLAATVPHVRLRALDEQELRDLEVAVFSSAVKEGLPVPVDAVHVATLLQHVPHHGRVTIT